MANATRLSRGFRALPVAVVAWIGLGSGCNEPPELGPSGGMAATDSLGAGVRSGGVATVAGEPPSEVIGERMPRLARGAANPTIPQEPSPFRFEDVAAKAGVDFVHFSGMTAQKHFPTANGSGAAVFDADGDGKLDLYFASATTLPLGTSVRGPNRLYRNRGDGTYEDATATSGLGYRGYCHGITVGDIDNDGDPDVFLSNYGSNVLYLNVGGGHFEDVSQKAGVDRPGWSSGGAFLDHDGDGDLDLYVSNYGEWKYPEDDVFCGDAKKHVRMYCTPRTIRTVRHFFYRNNGDGTFTDVAESIGLGRSDGRGFGVVAADVNGDGKIDIYVANDMSPNFLFLNKGDGTFDDATEASGAAYDEKGQAQSGMGVDAEDIDGDGRPDLFVTNFQNEYNTIYQNLGNGFMDMTAFFGMAADSLPWVGWGCTMSDFDSDGWPDAFVANGHVDDNRDQVGQDGSYAQPPLLHRNIDGRRFRLATRDVGPYFATGHVARGAAFGDLDDDGDLDIVINHKDGPAAVLLNTTPTSNRWVRLALVGTRSNRDAIGTKVEVETGTRTIHRQRKGGASMLSAHDPRVLIGVGAIEVIPRITVRWPSGAVSTLEQVPTNATQTLTEPKS